MKYFIVFIMFYSTIVFGQDKSIFKRDKFTIENYYLISIPDTLFYVKIYKDSVLQEETYSKTFPINSAFDKVGNARTYYRNGRIKQEYHFNKKGLLEGSYYSYYPNGFLESKIDYRNHVLKGYFIEYYSNGNVKVSGEYDYQEPDSLINNWWSTKIGTWKYYYKDGKIKREENYWKGKAIPKDYIISQEELSSGKELELDKITLLPDGTIDVGLYKRNVKHGIFRYWDKEGNLIKEENYNKGEER